MFKISTEFTELVSKRDTSQIRQYLYKDKKLITNFYACAKHIIENTDYTFFKESILDWKEVLFSQFNLDLCVQTAYQHILKTFNHNDLKKILTNFDFEENQPIALLGNYINCASQEKNYTSSISELLKYPEINWKNILKREPISSFLISIRRVEDLSLLANIVGKNNLDQKTLDTLLYSSIYNSPKTEVIDKIIEMGANIYKKDGTINSSYLNMSTMFPPKGKTYGATTEKNRRIVCDLILDKDKNIKNKAWYNFINRSFEHIENKEVKDHLLELIVNKQITPQYLPKQKDFFQILFSLSPDKIIECFEHYKENGFVIEKKNINMMYKVMVENYPQHVDALLDLQISPVSFLKSEFVKNLRVMGAKWSKKPVRLITRSIDALDKVSAHSFSSKLSQKLPENYSSIKKIKI